MTAIDNDVLTASSTATFGDLIVEAFQRFSENEAFVLGDRRMSYSEAADSISQIQQVLAERGIGHRSAVGALSINMPEVWLTQAAAFLLGARYTGLHPMGSIEDHLWICNDAEIEVLVVHPLFAKVGLAVLERSETVKHLLVLGDAEGTTSIFDEMARFEAKPLEAGPAGEEDVAWLQYTGGTTGAPKGVMVSQRAMVEECRAVLTSWQLPEVPRYLVAAPITHAGVLLLFPTLSRGGTVILQQSFDPKGYAKAIEEERANVTFGVPTMIHAILDYTTPEDADLSSLETFLYGAAPITTTRLSQAIERFGPIFVQGYGQTECVGMLDSLKREEHDPVNRPELLTSCGRPLLGTQVKILDDNDNEVANGTPGEICVRSKAVMNGYWKLPELTAETLRNGWLHTGDIGVRDEQGFLHIVDRKKDMVITGGFNVYPREIENALAAHTSIDDVAVIGVPDEKWGEAVTAYVVLHPGADLNEDELRALVREAKGAHQVPKHIHQIEKLPMTGVGKVDKKVLRAMSKQENSN